MKKLLSILCPLLICGCEVLEEDISDKTVRIVAPADRVAVPAGSVDFRWLALDHAAGYEFRVVSPSLEAADRLMADTVIRADTLARSYGCRIALPAGEYQWSVGAFNGSYRTRTQIRNITITVPAGSDDSNTHELPRP